MGGSTLDRSKIVIPNVVPKKEDLKRWNLRRLLDCILVELINESARQRFYGELVEKFKLYMSNEREAKDRPQEWRVDRSIMAALQSLTIGSLQQVERMLFETCAAVVDTVKTVLTQHGVNTNTQQRITAAMTPKSLLTAYQKAKVEVRQGEKVNIPWRNESQSVSCLRQMMVINLLQEMWQLDRLEQHGNAVWSDLETALLRLEALTRLTDDRPQSRVYGNSGPESRSPSPSAPTLFGGALRSHYRLDSNDAQKELPIAIAVPVVAVSSVKVARPSFSIKSPVKSAPDAADDAAANAAEGDTAADTAPEIQWALEAAEGDAADEADDAAAAPRL